MSTRERILMLRLMEKLEKYPAYATLLGVEATGVVSNPKKKSDPKGLASA